MSITVQNVAAWLKMNKGADTDANLDLVVKATNAFVESLPDKPVKTLEGGKTVWADQTVFGATMLAARLYNRRNSTQGIESISELGTSYVSRYDPDLARMLRIDNFQMPRVG